MLSLVLIEPENSGNIGAIARVMKNFSFNRLILINPKAKINHDAKCRAKHAQDILNSAKTVDFNYLDRFDKLIGTTAKLGTDYNITRSPLTVAQLAEKVNMKQRIALLIGREGIGLTNKEISKCDIVVNIPSSKKYPTLNISHAVAVILYELNKKKATNNITPASRKDIEVLEGYVKNTLDTMEFNTPDKKKTQKIMWKRIIGKAMPTKREAFALIGFFKKLAKK